MPCLEELGIYSFNHKLLQRRKTFTFERFSTQRLNKTVFTLIFLPFIHRSRPSDPEHVPPGFLEVFATDLCCRCPTFLNLVLDCCMNMDVINMFQYVMV